jgi:5-methylcytosine-specific restriction endonuclease McrA
MSEYQSYEYQSYLRSPEWKAIRAAAIARAAYRCERCGTGGLRLQVHHLTYERLGREEPRDLKVVCKPCHVVEGADYRHRRGLETYASKKYGEAWEQDEDYQTVAEEFDRWRDSKERGW